MNDLERDLRDVLHEDARRVPTPTTAPEGLRRSARRRQAVFGGAVALAGLAVVVGIVAGATTLLSQQTGPEPAAVGPKTTDTMNGITITYPEAWTLIDPDTAGLNGPGQMSESPLPRIVLALAPSRAMETFGCPAQLGGDEAAPLLMTIQEGPLAIDGPASRAWPAELEPLNVEATGSTCYPRWEFLRAGWTASGRTFEARVGFAPEASDEERDALFAAFATMTFEPAEGGASSVVLARGAAGGESWELIGTKGSAGLELTLEGESSSAGFGPFLESPASLQKMTQAFGRGVDRETVVFGPAPRGVVRVEATWDEWTSAVSADVVDVPDEIDPTLNAYVVVLPEGGRIHVRGYDASGQIVIQGAADEPEPASLDDTALEDGRHFGYVRSVDPNEGTIEFDLAYFLSGEEANQAYQEATGDTGPVPNDHFVVNDNALLRTLTLAPDVSLRLLDWNRCCETFFDGDLSLFAEAIEQQGDVTDGDLIYRGLSQWWITVRDGVVTQIEEQYSP